MCKKTGWTFTDIYGPSSAPGVIVQFGSPNWCHGVFISIQIWSLSKLVPSLDFVICMLRVPGHWSGAWDNIGPIPTFRLVQRRSLQSERLQSQGSFKTITCAWKGTHLSEPICRNSFVGTHLLPICRNPFVILLGFHLVPTRP